MSEFVTRDEIAAALRASQRRLSLRAIGEAILCVHRKCNGEGLNEDYR